MKNAFLCEYESFQREVLARRPRTVENYVPEVADFLRFLKSVSATPAEVAATLKLLDQATLLAFLRRPTAAQKTPGAVTWNMRLAAVRSLYAYLCRIDLLQVNPALRVDRQRTFERPTVPLDLTDLIALVESARSNSGALLAARNVALFQSLIHTALRVHEIVALNIEQVDMEHYRLLDVRRKGGRSLASTFNDVVAEGLQDYMATRPTAAASAPLFVTERGSRLSVRTVQELVKRHAQLAGIKQKVSPHLLRHSSATAFAALGTTLAVVQDICGHASVTTTQRYVHSNGEDRKRAAEALAAAWKDQRRRNGWEVSETNRLI